MFLFASVQNADENKITQLKTFIPIEVGKQVKYFREQNKLTQTELANLIGKDRQYLYKIEKGKVTPSIFTIGLIAYALEISFAEILGGVDLDEGGF